MRLAWCLLLVACSSPKGPATTAFDPESPDPNGPVTASTDAAVGSARPVPGTPQSYPSRADFARRLATVKPGMTEQQVRTALGEPDDIKNEADPGGISATNTAEIWRYGASSHLAFATLGSIHLQANRTVQYVFGGTGMPPAGFDEAELRRLLILVDAVPSYNATFDPLRLVQAVNALVGLDKGRVLAVLQEYLRVSSPFEDGGREGIFLLDRALFEVPKQGMPPMLVGAPDVEPPKDPKALPRFPLVFVDDLPLRVVSGYLLGGKAQDPESDVEWFRFNGAILRGKPLRPPDDVPLAKAAAYIDGSLAKIIPIDDALRTMLYDQLLRFTSTVYRPSSTVNGWFPPGPDTAKRWAKLRADVEGHGPKWDAAASHYTRKDGTVVKAPTAIYQRVWWDLALPDTSFSRITLERISETQVQIHVRFELKIDAAIPPGAVQITDAANKVLSNVPTGEASTASGSTSTWASGWVALIPKGTQVKVTYAQGSALSQTSPLLNP